VRVVLFANTDWYLYNFRLPLANRLRARGDEVILVSPPGPYGEKLRALGFTWHAFDFARKGTNPVAELKTLNKLTALYRTIAPDLAHHFTIKCVLYGDIAARRLGIPTVSAVTGMGHVFTTNTLKTAVLRPIVSVAYSYALKHSQVIFQNPDDRDVFLSRGLVNLDQTHLIRGSGVDIVRFSPAAILHPEIPPTTLRIVFVGRLLREKGVVEFVDAARIVRSSHPATHFQIAGDPDEGNPSSIAPQQIKDWAADGSIEFLGQCSEMPALLGAADICVLPSYREGTPRSLLEAAACGLPLVATDVPGCREICRDGINGLLVPARDANALAVAIVRLLDDPARRAAMGKKSREIVVAEFSEESVLAETLKVYERAFGKQRN
jgi:glycosyltransferase involved in cell wall biosynthesis